MVITRSAYRKAFESFDSSSDLSVKNNVPPWCSSSRKLHDRKRPRKITSDWDVRSLHPLRENIWEYLHDDKNFTKRKKILCKQPLLKNKRKNVVPAVLFIVIAGMTTLVSLWTSVCQSTLVNSLAPAKSRLISLLGIEGSTSVGEECCYRMKYLSAALLRAEQIIRNNQRSRRTLLLNSNSPKSELSNIDSELIYGARARKGPETIEWGGRVALWGVVPLWRATPPPDIVLAMRKPTPSNCWPFSGSSGELIIELPRKLQLKRMSVEHVKPDTARSAPKYFVVQGILENGTLMKMTEEEYKSRGPAKQYFQLVEKCFVSRVVFKVLSNQGNPKYTCVYRVHLYGSDSA